MRRPFTFASAAFFAASFVLAAPDPLGSLIDSEKEQEQRWLEEPRELPPVYLWGDTSGVEIDNPRVIGNGAALCSEIPYDQWLGLSDPSLPSGVVLLNTASPRLRSLLSDTCLIRPTDSVLAVGEGWQREVVLQRFVLRVSASPCPALFPYALWGEVGSEIPVPPLFFTTQLEFGERDNSFSRPHWNPLSKKDVLPRALHRAVSHIEDYSVRYSSETASNVDALYFLERRVVTPDDDDLPHHMVVWCKSEQCQILWLERVSHKRGSGHVSVIGTLDFNGDSRRDLLLEGDKGGCAYRKLFTGAEIGFSPIETPELACGC